MTDQNTPLLPGIFERSMSLDRPARSGSRAMGLFERMADRLDEIAANTRGGIAGNANMAQPRRRSIVGSEPIRRILGEKPPKERQPVIPPAMARQVEKSAPPSGAGSKPQAASKKETEKQPVLAREANRRPAKEAASQTKGENKAQSAEALARARQSREADATGSRIEDAIKNGMARLGGLAKAGGGAIAQQSDPKDAAVYALGGPLYGALTELKDAMPNFDLGKRDKEDHKTQAKEIAKAIEGQPGRRRDEKGRFVKPDQNEVRRQVAQTEVMQDQLDLEEAESKKEAKRHKELVRAVKNNKRGLLDKFLDRRAARGGRGLLGGGKNRERERTVARDARSQRDLDVDGRGKRGRAARQAGRRGLLSRAGGGLAKAGGAVAGSLMKGVGALGGILAKAAPMLAGAMAIYDGFKGWNDKELHKQAFGLKDGEEATTGQKASTAAASILDMGGLTSGILEMLGIEFDKAGVAKSIYDFGCNIASVAQGFLSEAGPMLQKVWGGIEDFAGKAWQGAKDFGAGIANFATGIWEKGASLVSGIGDLAAGVWEKGTSFVSGVADVAVGLWKKGSGLITSIGEGIGQIGSAIGDFATSIWNKGGELASSVAGWASSAIEEGVGILSGIWKGASETVSGIWAALTNFASSAVAKAGQVMSDMWSGVTETSGKLIEGAKDMAKSAIEGGGKLLSDGWKATKDFFSNIWPFGDKEAEAAEPQSNSGQMPKPAPMAENSKPETEKAAGKQAEATTPPATPPVPDAKLLPGQAEDAAKKIPTSSEAASGALALEQMNLKQREDKNQEELAGGLEDVSGAITRQTKAFEDRWRQEDAEKDPFGIKDAMDATTQQLASMRSVGGGYSGSYGGGYGGSSASGGGGGGAVNASMYNPDSKIGDTIAQYESGNEGVNKIGYDRMGGTSYGKWQLSSRQGSYEAWLKLLESKGGKHAEIAAQLRAAGPTNTGSRQGAHVEVYKKLAAENAQLFEDTQRESLLKDNYNVAMKGIKSESLRKMIEGDKSLQEMMFSTSVQHGGGGARKIFNGVYQEGMNREQLINAVYAKRAGQFGSSPELSKGLNRRFREERDLILGMNAGEARARQAKSATAAAMAQGGDAAVDAGMSALTAAATQKAVDDHVSYNMGSKNSASGQIDCSGWVAEVNRQMMNGINQAMGQEVFGAEARKTLAKGAAGGAAGIIQAVGEKTGKIYNSAELAPENVKEGMAIGMSLGKHAKGRFRDIGHIVQTYRDPETGEMMVSESASDGKGGGGVKKTRYTDWYAKYVGKRGVALHGVDMSALADSSKIAPAPQPAATAQGARPAQAVEAKLAAPASEELEAARNEVAQAEKELQDTGYSEEEAASAHAKGYKGFARHGGRPKHEDFVEGSHNDAVDAYSNLKEARENLAKLGCVVI